MSNKLHHPLWTHLPGLICVIAIAIVLARLSLPDRVPMQFDASGRPSSWGSPVELWLCALGVPLLVLIGSAVLDEVKGREGIEIAAGPGEILDTEGRLRGLAD